MVINPKDNDPVRVLKNDSWDHGMKGTVPPTPRGAEGGRVKVHGGSQPGPVGQNGDNSGQGPKGVSGGDCQLQCNSTNGHGGLQDRGLPQTGRDGPWAAE